MYVGLGVISAYIRENGFKSRVWQIMHVFRDDLGNIKGTKMVHGFKRVYRCDPPCVVKSAVIDAL